MRDLLIALRLLLFRRDRSLSYQLRRIIGFFPRDISIYKLALLHKSMMQRNDRGRLISNERLEFLGDAILGAIIGDIVYHHYPNKGEGFLTTTRAKLVQRDTLGTLANKLGLTPLLYSNNHAHSHNSYLGGNAFEALVGAIYLDAGYKQCKRFIERKILKRLVNLDRLAQQETNFKSKILEWGQREHVTIAFNLLRESKDANSNPIFFYNITIAGREVAQGAGFSKKQAQQQAAQRALRIIARQQA